MLQRVAMQIPRFRATLQSTDQLTVRVVDFLRQMFVDEKTKQLTVAVCISLISVSECVTFVLPHI